MTRLATRLRFLVATGLMLPIVAACSPAAPPPAPTEAPAAKAAPTAEAPAQTAAATQGGGSFVIADIGPLAKTLHPYPDAAAYSQSWTEAARLIWSGGLVALDADTLEYKGDMASEWSISSAIATADVVLTPGLAVDRSGMRLGRGGGSYDRALTRVPVGTFSCVLLYDEEVLDEVPVDDHDRPVLAAVTPRRLIRFPARA